MRPQSFEIGPIDVRHGRDRHDVDLRDRVYAQVGFAYNRAPRRGTQDNRARA